LRLDPARLRRHRGWRPLVLELRNPQTKPIEVTLSTEGPEEAFVGNVSVLWGDPRLEWPRPLSEIIRLLQFVRPQIARAKFASAARALHAHLSELATPPFLYQMWSSRGAPSPEQLARMTTLSDSLRYRPLVSIVTPVYNTDARWLRACIESVRRQAYPNWQLCLADDGSTSPETRKVLLECRGDSRIRVTMLSSNHGISTASNAALALADGEFVAFLDHDDEITPHALFEVVAHLNDHPDADFIYSDEDKLDLDGSLGGVYFKPDWSPEHLLNNMYTCHLMVVRRTLLNRIGGFREGYEGAQDYDLVLRLMDHTKRIHHLPHVLYHWRKIPESTAAAGGAKPFANDAGKRALEDHIRRNGLNADVLPTGFPCFYRTRFAIEGEPLISIVLPTDALEDRTINTLANRTAYRRFEVVWLTTGDSSNETASILQKVPCRQVRVDPDQFPCRTDQLNLAATHALGEHLLFLDRGMDALNDEWLTALLEYSQQTAIGAVGAKLMYRDDGLEHIGLLLGVNGAATSPLHRHPRSSLGYWGSAIIARNYSAVTAACMMTRRRVFEEVGGFGVNLNWFGDVDFGLRVRSAGYRIVFTPHAALVHRVENSFYGSAAAQEEADRLQRTWGDRLANDPYYNANLSRDSPYYEPDLSVVRH
jgi:GT2 family glycosyltransferase